MVILALPVGSRGRVLHPVVVERLLLAPRVLLLLLWRVRLLVEVGRVLYCCGAPVLVVHCAGRRPLRA